MKRSRQSHVNSQDMLEQTNAKKANEPTSLHECPKCEKKTLVLRDSALYCIWCGFSGDISKPKPPKPPKNPVGSYLLVFVVAIILTLFIFG